MWKIAFVASVGCAAEGRLPGVHFLETPDVLAPGHVSLGGATGFGVDAYSAAAGGGGRVRVGIGHDQELGVDATAVVLDSPGHTCVFDCKGTTDTRRDALSESALVSWKLRFGNRAIIAALGGSRLRWLAGEPDTDHVFRGNALDGSLGLLVRRGNMYAGLRAALAVPFVTGALPVLGGSAAFGGTAALTDRVRIFGEIDPRISMTLGDGYFLEDGPAVAFVAGLTVEL